MSIRNEMAWAVVCVLIVSSSLWSREAAWGTGELRGLELEPQRVELVGPISSARLIATGVFENDGLRDLSGDVRWSFADDGIAEIDDDGFLVPVADGSTSVVARYNGLEATLQLDVRGTTEQPRLHFANDVVPIFSKHSCNSGGCHGKSGGQNGFQLSLFGFHPEVDYDSLTRQSRGRRVFPAYPQHSLLLRKATGELPHGGGVKFTRESPEYELIRRWIQSGTPYGAKDAPHVTSIRAVPAQRVLERRARQQLRVEAVFSDGRVEDVSRLAQYESGDKQYASVDEHGLVQVGDAVGSMAVLVRYKGLVSIFRASIPSGLDVSDHPFPERQSFIDDHVFARLRRIGLPPSRLSTDAEFLRRVTADICGTLPTAEEARAFFEDERPDKRRRWIDSLLQRSEYARYFTLIWDDILRNRRGQRQAAPLTARFHYWLRESLASGKPYDRLVRDLLCAEGRIVDSPEVAWYRTLNNAKLLVDDTAQVFLGTRIQCARCHHHPHEKWSQDDYWKFANFFARVRSKNNSDQRDFVLSLRRGVSRLQDDEVISASYRKTYSGLRVLGGPEIEESPDDDPRQLLVDWMTQEDNPYFAKALVNRYWKHFFGRGIVEPEDDFRETNPASNPQLLEALAADFTKSGFDLRHVIRTICNSATYQLSSVPNEYNHDDLQNFSRFQPRRLPAEVLLDSIDGVLGTTTEFSGARVGARAIDLPDEAARNYFLDIFGKPARTTACSCERSDDVTLSQVLHLLSSEFLQRKLRDPSAPPARFTREERRVEEQLTELFLAVFTRRPRDDEIERAADYLAAASEDGGGGARRKAWEDLTWALLNTKEFLFLR